LFWEDPPRVTAKAANVCVNNAW